MAIYSFRVSVIKRADGRSSVAAAAYRAGEVLADERNGQRYDYSRKGGVMHAEIIAPENAPDWCFDRERLWNAVEATETRKNSQLAREITMALPHELTDVQRETLVRDFLQEQCVAHGMIADFAIHLPDHEGDQRNHHAHAMLTLREIEGDGFTRKAREWNDRGRLADWREAWAEHCNMALERAGRPERVDHRTLEAQGQDREPTQHEGPDVTVLRREGAQLDAAEANEAKRRRNADRTQLEERRALLDVQIERPDLAKAMKQRMAADTPTLKQALKELKAVDRQHGELNAVRREISKLRRELSSHDRKITYLQTLDEAVKGGFETVFKKPSRAQVMFDLRCQKAGDSPAKVARDLAETPDMFGSRRGRRIAILWRDAERKEADRALPILAEKARKAEYLRRKIKRREPEMEAVRKRLRGLAEHQTMLENLPNPERLAAQRQIHQAARGLSNEEWKALSWKDKKIIGEARRTMRDVNTRQYADERLAKMQAIAQEQQNAKTRGFEEERRRIASEAERLRKRNGPER